MRIGILTHNYPISASESKDAGKFVYAFTHELAKKNKVFVFCPDYGGKKDVDKQIQVTWFKWSKEKQKFGSWGLLSPLSLLKFIRLIYVGNSEVIDFARKNKIDYLLCFWNFPSGIFGWWVNKNLGIKYSTWALGSDIYIYPKLPIARQIIQIVLMGADNRFGNSYDICKRIEKLSGKKAKFLPTSNLISLGFFSKPKFMKNNFNFLSIARLEKVKGPDILIAASKLLNKRMSKFTVTFIGGGSMYEELNEDVRKSGLDDQIKILGYIEDQKIVNGYLKFSDSLIIPSRSESFPLVITEALQTGLPLIGSDVGDMPNFIGKNKLGFIFQKKNTKDLAMKMEKMIKDGKKLRSSKKKIMKDLSYQFRMERIVGNFLTSVRQ
jgi:glycosyltransferase involved in cell wall biosynthesis